MISPDTPVYDAAQASDERLRAVLLSPHSLIETTSGEDAAHGLRLFRTQDANEALRIALREGCCIVVDLTVDERTIREVAVGRASQTVPPLLLTIGAGAAAKAKSRELEAIAHLEAIQSLDYLRGALDVARTGFEIRRTANSSKVLRIHSLYDLTSRLLRIATRDDLRRVLLNSLPMLFEVPFIAITAPDFDQPLIFSYQQEGVFADDIGPLLQIHVRKAWRALRPDGDAADWGFLDDFPQIELPGPRRVTADELISAPITKGQKTRGFLTVIPDKQWDLDEPRIQGFFVTGDLLGVVLHNLELLEQLERRAMHDGLTGLFNRQAFMERFELECQRTQRHKHQVSLLILDLDHFKLVNDTYGHQAGDEALRRVAAVLNESIRETDTVGRAGGEEFMVLLPETAQPGAELLAERIRAAVEQIAFPAAEETVRLTASIGVASTFGRAAHADTLMARADRALYRAKGEGRNRVVVDGARPAASTPDMSSVDLE
ncbi:MAG: GGDEF domain-containing protein [Candidatus Sumerlaeia bacterium]|nr:GGDEF domain-containing protein [Candidatus Sumerlaeia bacterium]